MPFHSARARLGAFLAAILTVAIALPALAGIAPASASTVTTTGTLTLTNPNAKPGDDLVFSYSTNAPLDLNWVAVYNNPADGPSDQTYHKPSTAYTYTKNATTGNNSAGTVTVSGAKLTAGHDITAYFLANDGYTWLAQPITFQLGGGSTPTPPATTGTLKLTTANPVAGQPVTFTYTTDKPMDLNWVGIYNDPADGPTDQSYHAGSTAYTYTKNADSGDNSAGHDHGLGREAHRRA